MIYSYILWFLFTCFQLLCLRSFYKIYRPSATPLLNQLHLFNNCRMLQTGATVPLSLLTRLVSLQRQLPICLFKDQIPLFTETVVTFADQTALFTDAVVKFTLRLLSLLTKLPSLLDWIVLFCDTIIRSNDHVHWFLSLTVLATSYVKFPDNLVKQLEYICWPACCRL